jgi:probable HAF family extracellular repeat protein
MHELRQNFNQESSKFKSPIDSNVAISQVKLPILFKFALALGSIAYTCSLATAANAASFTPLGFLDEDDLFSFGSNISADGSVVVGRSESTAFRWAKATGMQSLGFLDGANFSEGANISADGKTIVGFNGYPDPTTGATTGYQAFRWTEATGSVGLGYLSGSSFSAAYGVSGNGSIVVGELFGGQQQGFRWTATGLEGLGYSTGDDVSRAVTVSGNGLFIAGFSGIGGITEAARWNSSGTPEKLGILSGYDLSDAQGISADGSTVVGYSYSTVTNGIEAFRWSQSTGMTGLGQLPNVTVGGSRAINVSADGLTVVGTADDSIQNYGFIWTQDKGMQSLQSILENAGVDLAGWRLVSVTGASSNGRIFTGQGINPNGNSEAWVADLDEQTASIPTPAMLPGLISMGIGAMRKRRQQKLEEQ